MKAEGAYSKREFFRKWRLTVAVSLLVLPPCIAMLMLLPGQPARHVEFGSSKPTREQFVDAHKEAMDRSTNFEQLLVALGSFELGIVAYVAGVVLGKEARIEQPKVFFGLFAALTFITTVTYLHTFRVYLGYGAYAVQLELAGFEKGLRPTTEVFNWSSTPHVPPVLLPAVALAGSLEAISLYPVFILVAAIVAFGRRLQMRWDAILALAIFAFGWAFLFAFPSVIEFVNLVRESAAQP